jgi:hypothetical protein
MVENNNGGLDYPVSDSTKAVISRTIEGIQRMISPHESKEGEETTGVTVIQINPAMKRHWESEIKIL